MPAWLRSAKFQLALNLGVLCVCLAGWPLSALTWARAEPQFILGLSWVALILTSFGNVISSQVNAEVQDAAPLASAGDKETA